MNISKPWALFNDLCDIANVAGLTSWDDDVLEFEVNTFPNPAKLFIFIANQLGDDYEVTYYDDTKKIEIRAAEI